MSRKHPHENLSKEFAKILFPTLGGAILFISLMLWLSSCSPKMGSCTNHQEKKAQRLLNKSYLLCDKPFIDLAAKRFDNTIYIHDTTWNEINVPVFDTLFVGDTVLVVKTDTKVVNHTITKQFENKAAIEQLNSENDNLRIALADAESNSEKYKALYTKEEKDNKAFHYKVYGIVFVIFILIVAYFTSKSYLKPISILTKNI